MEYRIRNDSFSATISTAGAELKSLVDCRTDRELLWHADPAWWKGSAPILFPIVGGLRNGSYRYRGREYAMGQHGFARKSEFFLQSKEVDRIEFGLASSPDTLDIYPFTFEFTVRFTLERTGLGVRYAVVNTGFEPMLFSIGSHPAFTMPFDGGNLEHYYLLFDSEENGERVFFHGGCIVAGRKGEIFESSRVIGFSRRMFDAGPIILPTVRSSEVRICKSGSPRYLAIRTGGAPCLGIWSKPGAPFVCVEPWHGLPDQDDATGELAEKPGILSIEAGEMWIGEWGLEVGG
jgi:galactose mutarotase-like enzyme